MKKTILILSFIALSGCATVMVEPTDTMAPSVQEMTDNNSRVKQIKNGMTVDEVTAVMGSSIDISWGHSGARGEKKIVGNPYKAEVMGSYIVFFYIVKFVNADNHITDEELYPVVFKNEQVVGKGWTYLIELKKSM